MVEHQQQRSPVYFQEKALLQGAALGHLDPNMSAHLAARIDSLVDARHPHTGATALHIAVQRGDRPLVRFLLQQAGADVNAVDTQHRTALHMAVQKGRLDLVQLLLQARANPNIADAKHRNIPYDEIDSNTTANSAEIKVILQQYGSFPRKAFYEVLFGTQPTTAVTAWLERLVRSIRNVHHGRLFVTVITAARGLQLVDMDMAQDLITEALFESTSYAKSATAEKVLAKLNDHVFVADLAPCAVTDLVTDFLTTASFTNNQSNIATMDAAANENHDVFAKSIQSGCLLVNGVDGEIESIRTCLEIYRKAYHEIRTTPQCNPDIVNEVESSINNNNNYGNHYPYGLNNNETSGEGRLVQIRMQALCCIVGAVINTLISEKAQKWEMEGLIARVVDFLDENHLMVVTADMQCHNGIKKGLSRGKNFLCNPKQDLEMHDFRDAAVMLGFCAGVYQKANEDFAHPANGTASDGSHSAESVSPRSLSSRGSRSTRSTRSSVRSFRSLSTAASKIFKDAFLAPQDNVDGRLRLHRAIVHRDTSKFVEALQDRNVEINEVDSNGRTALDLAGLTGQEGFFEQLASCGAQSCKMPSVDAMRCFCQARAPNSEDYFVYLKLHNTSGSETSQVGDEDGSLI